MAVGVIVAQFWGDLRPWARLALVATATAALAAAGMWTRGSPQRPIRALSGFLLFGSVAGLALFAGLASADRLDQPAETTVLAVGIASAAYAAVLWILNRSALQQLALFAALVTSVIGTLLQAEAPPWELFGLAVWGLGVVWALLGWGRIVAPERAAYVLGALAVLGGAQGLAIGPHTGWGLALGIASATALVGLHTRTGAGTVLWLGAAGLFVFSPQVVFEYFGDTLGAPVALLVSGLLLVVAGLAVARVRVRDVEAR